MKETFNRVKNAIFGSKKNINDIPENARQEMLKSLKWMEDFDLYSIDVSKFWESDVSMDWDIMKFKEWVVEADEVWNYIIINGIKCREYQPWISWFVYKNVKDRYHFREWLEIWFCDNWKFKKSIIIEDSWHPKECSLFPRGISRLLWWPLYEIKEDVDSFYKKKSNKSELNKLDEIFRDINRSKIYYLKSEFDHKEGAGDILYKEWVSWEDKNWKYLLLNWVKFYELSEGVSWLVYSEFLSQWLYEPSIFLAEYENGKMIWEWIVLSAKAKHIIRS